MLPKPETPEMIALFDLMVHHWTEYVRLKNEIEHKWAESARSDSAHFQRLRASGIWDRKSAVAKAKVSQAPKISHRAAYMRTLFKED